MSMLSLIWWNAVISLVTLSAILSSSTGTAAPPGQTTTDVEIAASALAADRIAGDMAIGAGGWVRTTDARIFDPPLYRLSYSGARLDLVDHAIQVAPDAARPHRIEVIVIDQDRRRQCGREALQDGAAHDHAR